MRGAAAWVLVLKRRERQLNSFFFFYTLALLIVCIAAAGFSVAAYASSRRRVFLFTCGVFTCYAIETTEIFFYEYILQNQPFPADEYYAINNPIIRTAVVVVLQACIWLIALDLLDKLDKRSRRLILTPIVCFIVANVAVLLMPAGIWQQWLYYILRSVFLLCVAGYILYTYHKSDDPAFRARLEKLRWWLLVAVVLVVCVAIEDTYVILFVPMSLTPSWLPLYLSERNFSENVLVCFFAAALMRFAYHVLSIRIKEAPVKEDVTDLERHIDEQMPFY